MLIVFTDDYRTYIVKHLHSVAVKKTLVGLCQFCALSISVLHSPRPDVSSYYRTMDMELTYLFSAQLLLVLVLPLRRLS